MLSEQDVQVLFEVDVLRELQEPTFLEALREVEREAGRAARRDDGSASSRARPPHLAVAVTRDEARAQLKEAARCLLLNRRALVQALRAEREAAKLAAANVGRNNVIQALRDSGLV